MIHGTTNEHILLKQTKLVQVVHIYKFHVSVHHVFEPSVQVNNVDSIIVPNTTLTSYSHVSLTVSKLIIMMIGVVVATIDAFTVYTVALETSC